MSLAWLGNREDAIGELREALAIKPDDPSIHGNLGLALSAQGKLTEAAAVLRRALQLNPDDTDARKALGDVLIGQRKWEEEAAEFRALLRRPTRHSGARVNLGIALKEQGKLEEAIAEYREVLRLEPDSAHAHANLGVAFRDRGEFTLAVAEFRKARDLARNDPRLAQGIANVLTEREQLDSLAARLPEVLAGKLQPRDTGEMLGLAQVCQRKGLCVASARLCAEAVHAQPKLAEEMRAQHRYNAVCAAALAGCGQGKDNPPPDAAAKRRWQKQAIAWLNADLAAWSKVIATGSPEVRLSIYETLEHWKADPDLAGLRDAQAIGKLPQEQQNACKALWEQLDRLLNNAPKR